MPGREPQLWVLMLTADQEEASDEAGEAGEAGEGGGGGGDWDSLQWEGSVRRADQQARRARRARRQTALSSLGPQSLHCQVRSSQVGDTLHPADKQKQEMI